MSLQPEGATKSISRQDRAEYALQRGFLEVYKSLPPEQRGDFGIDTMKRIREEMGVDYSQRGLSTAHFRALSNLLPEGSGFDQARKILNEPRRIEAWTKASNNSFNDMIGSGVYPVPFLDPQLRDVPGIDQVTSFNAVTRLRSLRSLNTGEALEIIRYGGKRDGEVIYGGSVPVATESVSNPFESQTSENTTETGQPAQTPTPKASEPDITEYVQDDDMRNNTEVLFTGWQSHPNAEIPEYGLDNVLGAYFTPADQEKLREHFDGQNVNIEGRHGYYLENSIEMLQYLRSNGIEFSVQNFDREGQIDVRLEGYDMSVRVFDIDDKHPGRYIGRLYNSEGIIHIQNRQENIQADYSPEESLIPLKLMLGHLNGEFKKTASGPNSQIHNVPGLGNNKYVFVDRKRNGNRFNAIEYRSDEEAVEFLEKAIEHTDTYFESQFNAGALKAHLLAERDAESQEAFNQAIADGELPDMDDALSMDRFMSMRQEMFMDDTRIVYDMILAGTYHDKDMMGKLLQSVDGANLDLAQFDPAVASIESGEPSYEDVIDYMYERTRDETVGSFDTGFNASFVIDRAPEDTYRQNTREAVMAALRYLDYDLDKIKGNDFATQNLKDTLIEFDEETARSIDEVDDPFLKKAMQRVQDNLSESGVIATSKDRNDKPDVFIDDQGVMRWEGHRSVYKNPNRRTKVRYNVDELSDGYRIEKQMVSGEIGQIFSPNEHGIIETNFGSGENYGLIPGYTGYFKFDGEYSDDRMERFRVKGYEQSLNEKIDFTLRSQVSRLLPDGRDNIAHNFESSALNGLYHGDVYGRRVDLDFVDKSQLKPEDTAAIITSLSNRVKFQNQYNDHATTHAEARAKQDTQHTDSAAFSYFKVSGETNMRVLEDDLTNIADLTMTGNARTQGVTWYLVDGATVKDDGSVERSLGDIQPDGTVVPDRTAIMKSNYFTFELYNAWNRNQMSGNQIMTAEHVAEEVGVAAMTFGGWTYEDSFAISKEFADRYKTQGDHPNEESMDQLFELIHEMSVDGEITKHEILKDTGMMWSNSVIQEGMDLYRDSHSDDFDTRTKASKQYDAFLEENGTFRPLKRGDKLSDFHGNKGTIGIVIDRNMDLKEAKKQDLLREVQTFKANEGLDMVVAPYSPLSRLNGGTVRELQSGQVDDITIPFENNGEGKVLKGALGRMAIQVTDLNVDRKTHAYTKEDVAQGKGRKASGQYAWALQSSGAEGIMHEIYGRNDSAWATYREYLIATGLDMAKDGTLKVGYHPQDDSEQRHVLKSEDYDTPDDFLNEITDKGGFLKVPFDVTLESGTVTDEVPILSAALRQDTELIDGTMRKSQFNNYYNQMFKGIKDYEELFETGVLDNDADEMKRQEGMNKAKESAQANIDKVQKDIIDRQIDGGSNGKHSFIRDKIMGVRMQHSATGVAISDPRLKVSETAMDEEMMEAMAVKQGDLIPVHRDPVWRKDAVDARKVISDPSAHGFAVHPATMAPKDGDLDGDTLGGMKVFTHQAVEDLKTVLSQHNRLVNTGTSNQDSYLPDDQDYVSAHVVAREKGDDRLDNLKAEITEESTSDDENVRKAVVGKIDEYNHIALREHGFGSAHIDLTSPQSQYDSLKSFVDTGAKGSPSKLEQYMHYYNGEATRDDSKGIQRAKGIQTDDTGLGGAVSQRLVSAMRNYGIDPALEVTYPVTQGILQIKHDSKHAEAVDGLLRNEISNLYKGSSSDGKTKSIKKEQWANDYHKVLTEKMGVDVNKELVDKVSDVMADKKGIIRDINTVIDEMGSPMDQVAYGGGYSKLKDMAVEGRSLIEGKANRQFAPEKMREGTVGVMAKRDVISEKQVDEPDVEQDGDTDTFSVEALTSSDTPDFTSMPDFSEEPVRITGKRDFKGELEERRAEKQGSDVAEKEAVVQTSLSLDDELTL